MSKWLRAMLAVSIAVGMTRAAAQQSDERRGAEAFGDWRSDAPGVRRLSFALKTATKAAPMMSRQASRATRTRSVKAAVSGAANAANGPSAASVPTAASGCRATPPSRIWRWPIRPQWLRRRTAATRQSHARIAPLLKTLAAMPTAGQVGAARKLAKAAVNVASGVAAAASDAKTVPPRAPQPPLAVTPTVSTPPIQPSSRVLTDPATRQHRQGLRPTSRFSLKARNAHRAAAVTVTAVSAESAWTAASRQPTAAQRRPSLSFQSRIKLSSSWNARH